MAIKKYLLFLIILIISIVLISSKNSEFDKNSFTPTIKMLDANISSEELARQLIKEVYPNVKFERQEGSGDGFLVRYYCSNICIDACEGGIVKYLCDVTARSSEDLFGQWLFYNNDIDVLYEAEHDGIIYKNIEGALITASLLINPNNMRVFAAEITIKYQ
ncbi:MAG: hypothetical protein IJ002_04295 [Clostridia bacterium]|nr:hypothetical protein [Clostridia bacterium]